MFHTQATSIFIEDAIVKRYRMVQRRVEAISAMWIGADESLSWNNG